MGKNPCYSIFICGGKRNVNVPNLAGKRVTVENGKVNFDGN